MLTQIAQALAVCYEQPDTPFTRTEGFASMPLDDAYRIQSECLQILAARPGECLTGRKISLTSLAAQERFHADTPASGRLLHSCYSTSNAMFSLANFREPALECELAFILKKDLTCDRLNETGVRAAIDYIVPALEILDCRYERRLASLPAHIADNAYLGAYILGDRIARPDALDTGCVGLLLEKDGLIFKTSDSSGVLGDPVKALTWLAFDAIKRGCPLQQGEVILSGAFMPAVPLESGCVMRAVFSGLDCISVCFD